MKILMIIFAPIYKLFVIIIRVFTTWETPMPPLFKQNKQQPTKPEVTDDVEINYKRPDALENPDDPNYSLPEALENDDETT